ncbi:hypothetical protein HAP47_0021725 [Bradyrhizobium sp. 41S5]|uniref:hypothetical protein n=1 Tax=Bradyrhizobium sp. 41S5 TaxID=1404443 RepID=UPI00156B2781|nr:hypothetical protein [Bradyrhizobium sp. 41S5]UFX41919.1 hypothetical protein HAP47_0021725 [Bradyrhizobium sp. 41S5]
MTNLTAAATSKIEPSTPFCAGAYYTALRDEGCDPIVRNGALQILINGSSENSFGRWAALHDPDGSLRKEYARAAWAARTSDEDVILLGVG